MPPKAGRVWSIAAQRLLLAGPFFSPPYRLGTAGAIFYWCRPPVETLWVGRFPACFPPVGYKSQRDTRWFPIEPDGRLQWPRVEAS